MLPSPWHTLAEAARPLIRSLPLLALCAAAQAEIYRCEVSGKVSYSDARCPSGDERTLSGMAPATPQDRAAAERRLARDQAELARLQALRQKDDQAALQRQMQLDIARMRATRQQKAPCPPRLVVASATGPKSRIKPGTKVPQAHTIPNPACDNGATQY